MPPPPSNQPRLINNEVFEDDTEMTNSAQVDDQIVAKRNGKGKKFIACCWGKNLS